LPLAVIISHISIRAGIPTFQKIVKRPHRIYKQKEIGPILDYFSQAELLRAAIAKLHQDAGIPHHGYSKEKGFEDSKSDTI
jgi:hypothetical protein